MGQAEDRKFKVGDYVRLIYPGNSPGRVASIEHNGYRLHPWLLTWSENEIEHLSKLEIEIIKLKREMSEI